MAGLVAGNALQIAVIYVPALNRVFHTVPIPPAEALAIGAAASIVLWVEEARKWIARRQRSAVSSTMCAISAEMPWPAAISAVKPGRSA